MRYRLVEALALVLACSCGKATSDDEGSGGGVSEGGRSSGGASASGGSTRGGASSSTGGSAGAVACPPFTCDSTANCVPVSPQQALLTDFSDLDQGVFHSDSSAWWTEMFGGTYVYPMKAECGDQPAGATLTQDHSGGDWAVTGRVDTYSGFGVWFAPCLVDMSMYGGFSFTFVGNVGPSRSVTAHVVTASNTAPSIDPANPTCAPNTATCQAADPSQPELSCRYPSLRLADIGGEGRTLNLRFSDFTGGLPDDKPNPAEVVGFFFELDWQFDGTAADAYPVEFYIDDLTLW